MGPRPTTRTSFPPSSTTTAEPASNGGRRPNQSSPESARRSAVAAQAIRSGGRGPAGPAECRDRRRACAVPELPAVRLVVPGHRGVRLAGLGADPRNHNARRRIRVRIPVRAGVLSAAAAVDQRARRCDSRGSRCAILQALFPALFGWAAVFGPAICPAGRSGSPRCGPPRNGSSRPCPFGGFPWGVVGFSQTNGPLLAIAQLGGAPLLSFAVVLIGFSLAAITFEVVKWWRHDDEVTTRHRPPWCCPVCASAPCC